MKTLFRTFALFMSLSCTKYHQPIKSKTMQENKIINPHFSRTDTGIVKLPNTVWKHLLSPELYHIAREAGTERPHSGKFNNFDEKGDYYCAACGNHLFKSTAKFASTCGWPSFYEADKNGVKYRKDISHGMDRIEVLCKRCDSHLGHVFNDGPEPTGVRFCMNSISLDFEAEK
ncbi:peptide-methionine (R)-S-oxide reductase MsrB [Amniculibacterium aquaticum]|jgi:peptide-methionine (R)-S-oxide reductase|uniref:peptide-methionine (R)-S-oxide reductase MsrB n=1 Tax=Amniculibacterium TaxID=2715289 RepID=UPI0019D15039